MMRRVLWLGAYLVIIHAAVAAEGGCEQNRSVNIDRYIDALKGDPRDVASAIFRQVPNDMAVVQENAAYVARDATAVHQLPLEASPTSGALRSGDRFTSSCRVKDPAGDWWLVIKSKDAVLTYVPESKTKRADAADGKAGTEPEKRSKDPLLQGKY